MRATADLSHLATPGSVIEVRVTPRSGRNAVALDEAGAIRVLVTAVPEGGQANDAVRRLLARALGLAPTRLVLVRGEKSRDKAFRITP